MPITINTDKKQSLEFANADEQTKEISQKIYELSKGMTISQFTLAIEFALEKTADYLILRDELRLLE